MDYSTTADAKEHARNLKGAWDFLGPGYGLKKLSARLSVIWACCPQPFCRGDETVTAQSAAAMASKRCIFLANPLKTSLQRSWQSHLKKNTQTSVRDLL